jgi:hypothetical protein
MKNMQEIQRNLSSLKDAIHNAFGVSSIEVFGSFVRGEQREDSDIDVLVDFDRDVSLLDVSALQVFLTEQLGAQIDVVLKRSVRKELKDRIFAEAVPV